MTPELKSKETKKRVLIQLRTTEHDKQTLLRFAKESGMTLTDFVKARTLGKPPRIKKANFDREILIRLLAELGKVGSNINQIAKVMNTEKKTFYTVAVKETLIARTLTDVGTLSSEILKQLEHDREGQNTGERQPVSGLSPEGSR